MCKWGIFLIRRVRALGGKHYALVLGSSSAVLAVIVPVPCLGQKGNGLTHQHSLKKSGLMIKRNRKNTPKQATKAIGGRKVPIRVDQVGKLNLA